MNLAPGQCPTWVLGRTHDDRAPAFCFDDDLLAKCGPYVKYQKGDLPSHETSEVSFHQSGFGLA